MYPVSLTPEILRPSIRTQPVAGTAVNLPDILRPTQQLAQGHHLIAGTIQVDTTPVARVVRLYERATGRLVREVVSGADGWYAFQEVQDRWKYYVVGLDTQPGGVNADIADYITPS